MKRTSLFAVLLFAVSAVFICNTYCQDYSSDDSLRAFEGKVASIDIGKSILVVKGVSEMTFQISNNTKLTKDVFDIELSDISAGDYVNIEYSKGASQGSLMAISVTVEYGKT